MKPSIHDHVAVVVEPSVHVGLATLTNSLVRDGFCGTVWVGCRGALPAFAAGSHHLVDIPTCSLRFRPFATERLLPITKPNSGPAVADHCPTADSLCYSTRTLSCIGFRPSSRLAGHGVALCEDHPYYSVSVTSPIRSAWADLMALEGIRPVREVDRYFNAGFIGVPRAERRSSRRGRGLRPWLNAARVSARASHNPM